MSDQSLILPMTAEMVRAAARIHLGALPESRTALMGESYLTSFMEWFCQPEHGGVALAAINDRGDVVGYAVGAPLGYAKALSRRLFWKSAIALAARPSLIFKSQFRKGVLDRVQLVATGAISQRHDLELPAPTMSLVAMGVSAAFRRRQLGLRLLENFEERALEMGMRSMRLSTRSDNTGARRLYEGRGWRPLGDSGDIVYYFRILEKEGDAG